MKYDLDKVPGRMLERRKELGLTRAQLAERVGLISDTIARFEADEVPSLWSMVHIAEALDVSIDWLCGKGR